MGWAMANPAITEIKAKYKRNFVCLVRLTVGIKFELLKTLLNTSRVLYTTILEGLFDYFYPAIGAGLNDHLYMSTFKRSPLVALSWSLGVRSQEIYGGTN